MTGVSKVMTLRWTGMCIAVYTGPGSSFRDDVDDAIAMCEVAFTDFSLLW